MRAVLAVARHELARIFRLRPVFSVMVLAPLIYAVLYPQPYVNEALRDVPLAVVDLDGSTASRDFLRRLDATQEVAIALSAPDLPAAQRAVWERRVHGILVLPPHFERDLLHGRAAPVALYADAGYFLIYSRIAAGVGAVARTLGAEVEAGRLIAIGVDPALAVAATDPMPLTTVSLFNPQGGYATYVLPGALVLILQQTLLIGMGLLACMAPAPAAGPVALVLGRLLAGVAVQAVMLPFYLVGLTWLYGIPRLGGLCAMALVGLPFVLAVAALGLLAAAVLRRPLTVQLATAAMGLPVFFLAGFAWPPEAIPGWLRPVAQALPSTSAIDAFVRIAQMGAAPGLAAGQIRLLGLLAALYAGLAMLMEALRASRAATARASGPSPAGTGASGGIDR
ncbi:ABC transporter permease [Rhodovarius crocodyli]|uniref:ABC transporter permease n=1 Tax=Rhodovarius crocodyli TaxID=1979269 RepID=A0A437M219_9PROT|nr:ABC transporter permease [Rhodovarius crocodyli]RVT91760.1 ABC transporter permease [Rhodovarius crocodyli]